MKSETVTTRTLAVVGANRSGKTSLIFRFTRGRLPYNDERLTTISEMDDMVVTIDGEQVHLVTYDLTDISDYVTVRSLIYSQVDGAIICFSLNSPETLSHVEIEWWPELRHSCHNKPIFLVGTKRDLRDNSSSKTPGCEFVTKKQGKQMAKRIGAAAYIECTALDDNEGVDVKGVFDIILREMLKRC